jgi:DNA (cytosine-5)-methyltransferase 1
MNLIKKNNYLSLYSSAGVGCFGFKKNNFNCIATVEIISKRLQIQKFNKICDDDEGYINDDISKIQTKNKIFNIVTKYKKNNNISEVDVVIATPPCQGISVANHKKKDELKRNSLIVDSFIITKEILPKFFLFENVQNFLKTICTNNDGKLMTIQESLNKILLSNYFISSKKINLCNFGSNSSRTRTLILGCRRDLNEDPDDFFPDYIKEKKISELISHLPKLEKFGDISENDIYHSFRNYDKKMLPWIKDLKQGQGAFENKNKNKIPHRIINGKVVINQNKNGDKYKRVFWNQVAPCVHTRNDILASQNTIHPKENRVFSIRELMIFMSIPNDFVWTNINSDDLNKMNYQDKVNFLKKNELNIRKCIGEAVPTETFSMIAKKISNNLNISRPKINSLNKIKEIIIKNNLKSHENIKNFLRKNIKNFDINFILKCLELSNQNKDDNSAYYTDDFLVRDIINSLPEIKKDTSILEPSVGCGSFLFQILKKYKDCKNKINIDLFDIDNNNLDYIKIILKSLKISKNIKINFYNEDFLKFNFNKKYDLVIGNPPFEKINNKKKLEDYFKNKIINKNTNQFILFLKKSIKVGKVISLVLPKSFLSAPDYNEERKNIENLLIHKIIDFGEKGFKGVKIETISIIIENKKTIDNKINIFSYINNSYNVFSKNYIIDKKFPYWLIYRNNFFDKMCGKILFNKFDFFRDRQITKSLTGSKGKFRVIKSRNIDDRKIINILGYDTFINKIDNLAVSKFLNKKNLYIVPNLSYYPRASRLPNNSVVDGSAAILIPKNSNEINEEHLKFFSTEEFREFYKVARNFGTRSLNIDKNSIFFWGLKKHA